MQHSGFCHPTRNIESRPFLAVCHCLLNIFAATLHIWKLSPPSAAWWSVCHVAKGGNSWWFSEAALKYNRKHINCVRFSNVTCEMELNVECASTSTGGTFSPWLWQVLLNCLHFFCALKLKAAGLSHSFFLPFYMGHICGLQCYDDLGRICAVVTVKKKAVDNFPVEQSSWKVDIHSSSQETPSLSGKLTFISELKLPATEGHCDMVYCLISFNARLSVIQMLLL